MERSQYELKCQHTNEILFSGYFLSIKDAVEQAVIENVCLDAVKLEGANLTCANMDDAQLMGANFKNANLNGANLSESVFDYACFQGADLSHACLALASCMNSNMLEASFAATDVTDAVISGCDFSCPSVFSTLFARATLFTKCQYHDKLCRKAYKMTKPPVVITGLPRDIVYLDHVIKIGHDFISKVDMVAAGYKHLEFLYGHDVASFIHPYSSCAE